MKIFFKQYRLLDLLSISKKFIAKKAMLPVLKCVQINAKQGGYSFIATDLDSHIILNGAYGEHTILDTTGSVVVDVSLLLDIVKKFAFDDDIVLYTENNLLHVEGQGISYQLFVMDIESFPAMPDPVTKSNHRLVHLYNGNDFINGINKLSYCVNKKNFSPVLTGIYLSIESSNITMVGTDSFRLGDYKFRGDGGIQDGSMIMPIDACNKLSYLFSKKTASDNVELEIKYNDYVFQAELDILGDIEATIISLTITGNYPNYDRDEIIPQQFNYKIPVNGANLLKGLQSILVLTKPINDYVNISYRKLSVGGEIGEIILKSGKTSQGEVEVSVLCSASEFPSFGINGRYLMEFIKQGNKSDIVINIVDPIKPMSVEGFDPKMRYIIRPLIGD